MTAARPRAGDITLSVGHRVVLMVTTRDGVRHYIALTDDEAIELRRDLRRSCPNRRGQGRKVNGDGELIRAVPCPTCQAHPGLPCVSRVSGEPVHYHYPRLDLAHDEALVMA